MPEDVAGPEDLFRGFPQGLAICRAVQDAVTALAVADLCAQHFGKDWQVAQAWNMG